MPRSSMGRAARTKPGWRPVHAELARDLNRIELY
jgi:hypothetical protein